MRYDVNFKIGDYIGPLNYSFTGDDDLWVILDGKEVVIDLGGIHKALTDEVDLWNYILHEGYTEEEKADLSTTEKEQEHTLTILYMERGAEKSNCNMNFTLPSAKISEVTTVPMADLLLRKVNKDKDSLEGAAFSLKDSTGNTIQTAASTGDGSVKFSKLREGTYILEETKAPSGYIPSLETWVVKVKVAIFVGPQIDWRETIEIAGNIDSSLPNIYVSVLNYFALCMMTSTSMLFVLGGSVMGLGNAENKKCNLFRLYIYNRLWRKNQYPYICKCQWKVCTINRKSCFNQIDNVPKSRCYRRNG